MIMKVMYVTYQRKCFRVTKDTWSWKFTVHKRKQTLACFYMQNMQKRSPLPSSSHLKTQMCSSCHFHLSVSLLVRCTLRVAPKPEKNLLMCRRVAAAFSQNTCSVLPGLHSFTGCDTVSAFEGKKKISAFKLMQKNTKYQDAFTQLGKELSVLRDLFNVFQEFTCKLYAARCPNAT